MASFHWKATAGFDSLSPNLGNSDEYLRCFLQPIRFSPQRSRYEPFDSDRPGNEGDNITLSAACELVITAPAVTTVQLPDAQTLTYFIEEADDEDFTVPVVTNPAIIVQTGAGGSGAGEQIARFAPPSTTKRYLRFGVTKSGAGDASAAQAKSQLSF